MSQIDNTTFLLTVTKSGTGTGTITSSPAGIDCGSDCSELYAAGTTVTLTATPNASSTFSGWSGAGCSGTGTCIVTMSSGAEVDAAFAIIPGYCSLPLLTKDSTTALSNSLIGVGSIDTVNNIGYFSTEQNPAKVLKINLSTLAELGALTLTGSIAATASSIDTTNGFLYISTTTGTGGAAYKVRLSDFTLNNTLPTGTNSKSIALDIVNGYGYFIIYAGAGDPKVYKIRLSDLTLTGTLMTSNALGATSCAIDTTNGFLYITGRGASDKIVRISKINLATFSETTFLNTGVTEGTSDNNATAIDIAGGHLFIGLDITAPKFMKVDLTTFTLDSSITSPVGNGISYNQSGIDVLNGYVYFVDQGASTRIFRIKISDNSYSDSLALSAGANKALIVNAGTQYAYVGTYGTPANVVTIDLCGD